MIDEGYIKFACDWTEGPPPPETVLRELNETRQRMHALELIGHSEEDDVDFGNISIRGPEPGQLIISGTQTGHLAQLTADHYALVTDADIGGNRVACRGRVKASSETLTHAAIYALDPQINGVIHVHALTQWNRLLHRIPTTAPGIPYGTPAMATEFQRLYGGSDLPRLGVAAMGGHPAGIVSFGRHLAEAEQRLLDCLSVDS